MGKKGKGGGGGASTSLGRTLIKDRFGGPKTRRFVSDNSMLHTTEIQDGYDWGRLNLQSVTEESSFQEFLSTAELAGTEFQAEKLNIKFINPRSNVGLLSKDEKKAAEEEHEKHKEIIKIPRRPAWNAEMSVDELQLKEREAFLEWRRKLALVQQEEKVLLTPYEKNLEFWRQLWRVVERSDVVVQIVDARNPLLFRCHDLESYVKEVSENKINMILVNKADFLTEDQREFWAKYFESQGMPVAFFSAVLSAEVKIDEESEDEEDESDDEDEEEDAQEDIKSEVKDLIKEVDKSEEALKSITEKIEELITTSEGKVSSNSSKLLTREELIELFKKIHTKPKITPNLTTIGLVGYPNVGKSSTINTLMTVKKVSVSATPGKTKHFQTLFLEKDLMLCDCPGLVMPSFVFTKAEMVINGILPIDQMRDHVPPVNLVSSLIPRRVIEDKYGIMLPTPMEGEDETRPPTAEELLNCYGFNRGFMTANGQPDNPRSARYILKDYMNGKLLYAHAPPGIDQNVYHVWEEKQKVVSVNHVQPPREIRASKPNRITSDDIDKVFFSKGAQTKGKFGKSAGIPVVTPSGYKLMAADGTLIEKPWKKIHKYENKKKKEKLRRVYAHLDQH